MRASLLPTAEKSTLALLWDESYLWGIMLYRTLSHYNIPCRLLRSRDVADGALQRIDPGAILVPGGWSRRKSASLGTRGRRCIQDYVSDGGTYIGFCGGAGLALSKAADKDNLDICPWSRKPMSDRLVNCSGHIQLRMEQSSTALQGKTLVTAPVWWPSQFDETNDDVRILASYLHPADDFWVADLPLEQLEEGAIASWENHYGINLDPDFLTGEPCVISGRYGSGSYILSYAHLETPGSPEANAWLCDILAHLLRPPIGSDSADTLQWDLCKRTVLWDDPVLLHGEACLTAIVEAGKSNFLLNWRNSWLLGWRRGIPGFALNTLIAQLTEVMNHPPATAAEHLLRSKAGWLYDQMSRFKDSYIEYLSRERLQSLSAPSSPVSSASQPLQKLREELVGPFPGQTGVFGELSSFLDELLWKQVGTDLR